MGAKLRSVVEQRIPILILYRVEDGFKLAPSLSAPHGLSYSSKLYAYDVQRGIQLNSWQDPRTILPILQNRLDTSSTSKSCYTSTSQRKRAYGARPKNSPNTRKTSPP